MLSLNSQNPFHIGAIHNISQISFNRFSSADFGTLNLIPQLSPNHWYNSPFQQHPG